MTQKYLAFKIAPDCRVHLLNLVSPVHGDVFCDHITLQYNLPDCEYKLGELKKKWSEVTFTASGWASNDETQVIVVDINASRGVSVPLNLHITVSRKHCSMPSADAKLTKEIRDPWSKTRQQIPGGSVRITGQIEFLDRPEIITQVPTDILDICAVAPWDTESYEFTPTIRTEAEFLVYTKGTPNSYAWLKLSDDSAPSGILLVNYPDQCFILGNNGEYGFDVRPDLTPYTLIAHEKALERVPLMSDYVGTISALREMISQSEFVFHSNNGFVAKLNNCFKVGFKAGEYWVFETLTEFA